MIFKCVQPDASFWKVNPNLVAQDILRATQEKIISHKINRQGHLIICVRSERSAKTLLATKFVAGIEIAAAVPDSYLRTLGRISNVPRRYSDSQLLEYLRHYGITHVRREMAFSREEDGSAKAFPKSSVVLTFHPGTPLPRDVCLGFNCHPVTEYIAPPVQCFKCQRFGHYARDCRGSVRCKVCAGDHDFKVCSSRCEAKCANCQGPHVASFGACPVARGVAAAHARKLTSGVSSIWEACPNPDFVKDFPPLPEATGQQGQRHRAQADTGRLKARQSYAAAAAASNIPSAGEPTAPAPPSAKPATRRRSTATKKVTTPQEHQHHQAGHRFSVSLKVFVPLLFAAFRAVLRDRPSHLKLPEVEALLALEPLLLNVSSEVNTAQSNG